MVAAVVAESRALAEDARDLVEVEYDPLPVVATAAAALAPGAPLVYEELGDNVAAHIVQRVGHPERAFAAADHTLRETFRVMRGGSHTMEGRGVVARYDEALDAFTVWDATQTPHAIRAMLAYLFDLPEHRVRVIAPPDVGGGLGPKGSFYPEEALVCWLARRLRRPVKWIEDRLEHFLSAAQEREQIHTVEIAFTRDGTLLALRDVFTHDIGMYGALVSPVITACTVPGPYRIPNIHSEVTRGVHQPPAHGAVRGAGRPQGVLVMERMMDRMAETLGLDPAGRALPQPDPRRRVSRTRSACGSATPRRSPTTAATTPSCCGARSSWPTTRRRGASRRGCAPRAATAASAWPSASRAWASGPSRAPSCGSTPAVASW